MTRRLEVRPSSVRCVYLSAKESKRRRQLSELARRNGVEVRQADEPTLRRHTGSETHQGVAAAASPFEYSELGDFIADGGPVLVLDQVSDPQNLGALVRTAVAAGFVAVIIPDRGASGVTPAVEKASAGAVHDIAVCRVVNLARSLERLGKAGYWCLALMPRAEASLYEIEVPRPVAVVVGGETGVRRLVAERCDLQARIPLVGPIESLNASVAGALAMYEVLRRQQT